MDLLSATLLLIIVTDPLGNVPMVLVCLEGVQRKRRFIIREVIMAFIVLVAFLLFGPALMRVLGLTEEALRLAGGLILFLIAIKMIFPPSQGHWMGLNQGEEPLLFPLAVPLVAGPSAVATVTLFAAQYPDRLWIWFCAICITMAISLLIFLSASTLHRFMGHRGLSAMEKLMGLILAAISVQMMVTGVREVFAPG
jgi:MarC family membrane protein